METDIYQYIKSEEGKFSDEIQVGDNWNWNFKNHTQLLFHLSNGMFFTGANDYLRAFKNIMEPILNLCMWTEKIDLKDVDFYMQEEAGGQVLSFILKKYHDEVYARENDLDTMFDEITESDLTYGGALVQKTKDPKPEVLELKTIAFCDQTDMLGGPIGFKHNFSPSRLRKMSKLGWGSTKNGATTSIDDLIILADALRAPDVTAVGKKNVTTGKNIEVYIVRGDLPEAYLKDNDNMEKYVSQVQIVAFYTDGKSKEQGVTLYRKEDDNDNLKFFTSKKVYGRALGRGVGEGLIHPQIWTNFFEIHKTAQLEAGSKTALYTDDQNYTNKNKIQEMENLEVTVIEDGKQIHQVPTTSPVNVQLLESSINEWYAQGQLTGAAQDPILGKQAPSGSTFRGQERAVAQNHGAHADRLGKRAKFIAEIYRDIIIPRMSSDIMAGKTFLATLSSDELVWVVDRLSDCWAYEQQFNAIMNGQQPGDPNALKQEFATQFAKRGNKLLFEILKGEFKDIEIKVGVNVADKQKDLAGKVDSLVKIFQTIIANPYILSSPPIGKLFNKIVEAAGLEPIDLTQLKIPRIPAMRITEQVAFKDMPPEAQKEMLQTMGYAQQQDASAAPAVSALGAQQP